MFQRRKFYAQGSASGCAGGSCGGGTPSSHPWVGPSAIPGTDPPPGVDMSYANHMNARWNSMMLKRPCTDPQRIAWFSKDPNWANGCPKPLVCSNGKCQTPVFYTSTHAGSGMPIDWSNHIDWSNLPTPNP